MTGLSNSIKLALLVSSSAIAAPTASEAYPIDCAIFLCLAGGWPSDPDCNAARAEFIRRITPMPVEPPLQLWRCPMGAAAGSTNLSPMQRLEAIKEASAHPLPELPSDNQNSPQVVEASNDADAGNAMGMTHTAVWKPLDSMGMPWANLGDGTPALPAPTLATVDLSASDFDVVRSIRVWDVRHYSYRVREREGPCEVRLDMQVGTYDANADFHWSDRAPGPRPDWLPLRRDCPSSFRGVGVEWSDTFGNYDYVLVPY